MASSQRGPLHVYLCLFLSACICLASPTTGDDTEAMRQRLLAIEAERALLHQRLGLQATEDSTKDGIGEVFENLMHDLTPLLPQLAWEMTVLGLAGVLTYLVTKQVTIPKKGKVIKAVPYSQPVPNDRALKASASASACAQKPFPHTRSNTSSYLPFQDTSPSKTCKTASLPVLEAAKPPITAMITPPPGLVDPGPPPGLECLETSLFMPGDLDQQEVVASSNGQEVVEEFVLLDKLSETIVSTGASMQAENTQGLKSAAPVLDAFKEDALTLKQKQSKKRKKTTNVMSDAKAAELRASDTEPECEPILHDGCQQLKCVAANHAVISEDREASQDFPRRSSLDSWRWLPGLFQRRGNLVDAESDNAGMKQTEKLGKRKGKHQQLQHQRGIAPKRISETPHKKMNRPWGLHWPCSAPLTAAILAMLCIILAGKAFDSSSDAVEQKEQELVEKRMLLQQLKQQRNSQSRRLALMHLEEFIEESDRVTESLPVERRAKLKSARQDANSLLEALNDIADDEFPQVEESFTNVYTSWKQTLASAKRLADLDGRSELPGCPHAHKDSLFL